MPSWLRTFWQFPLFLAAAFVNFFVFGLKHAPSWKDASEYSGYASNLLAHGMYSLDGVHFSILREPGYPFFLWLIYAYFGNENLLAVALTQAILLALIGYMTYRIFAEREEKIIGVIAGFSVCLLPRYGYYTNEILSEILFATLLTAAYFLALHIISRNEKYAIFGLFGIVLGYLALVRTQTIFFLPFLFLCYLIFMRPYQKEIWKKFGITFLAFLIPICGWMMYVHAHTGVFAITAGRQEEVLNIRAVRSALSYKEITQYGYEWLRRSISGGGSGPMLDKYEWKTIGREYYARATTSAAVLEIKKENIRTILTHPGEYLYGNFIELMKVLYIDHDFNDSANRYFRAAEYVVIYLFFAFGLYQLVRARRHNIKILSILALIFLAYNYLFVTMFDTVPRFNTPYLVLYIIVGFVGVVLFRRNKHPRS
jgi:4-amino-4-deoxy-L-arabinose transferase-like glycosyltransferase